MGRRYINFEKVLGERVRQLRDDYGWSQEELANIADIDTTQVSRLERGAQSATLKTVVAVSLALGKYPHELLNLGVDLQRNNDFTRKKKRGPKATTVIGKLLTTDFFSTAQSVGDTISQCKKLYQIDLISSAVSAILKDAVETRKLVRVKDSRRFLYKKRSK